MFGISGYIGGFMEGFGVACVLNTLAVLGLLWLLS
jgi:hypothetical protein